MKNLKGQVFGLLIVLSGVASLSGMNLSQFSQKARLQVIRNRAQKNRYLSSAAVQVPTQKRLQSISAKPTKRSFSRSVAVETSAQKKGSSGLWSWLFPSSPFLTPREVDDLLWGHVERDWIDFGGTKRDRMVFGEIDLANAKEKIDTMMENNSDYKKSIIEEYPYYFKFGHGVKNPKQTILDKVFFHLFNGDEDRRGSVVRVDFSDNALNLIKLIQHLMAKGAMINPENVELYKSAYFNLLMPSYCRFYESKGEFYTLYDLAYAIQKFQEVFKELDPILETIIPGIHEELIKAQQERADIEANPEKYKKQKEDERSRNEFIEMKAKELCRRANDSDAYWTEFTSKVKFDEKEYQEWLRSGKKENTDNFSGEKIEQNIDKKIEAMKKALKIPLNSSAEATKRAITLYIKRKHSDTSGKKSDKKKSDKFKNFMNNYNDIKQELDKRIRLEKENRA